MDRVLARLRGTEKDSKNDGSFMFAISLIIASLTITYKSYVYLCNNLIADITYSVLYICIILMIATFISMSLFILVKAISLEVKNPKFKKKLETYATSCYLIGFLFGILIIIYLLVSCALKVVLDIVGSLFSIPNTSHELFFAYIITLFIIIICFKIDSINSFLFTYKPLAEVRELYNELFNEIDKI